MTKKERISNFVGMDSYLKGMNYPRHYVRYLGNTSSRNGFKHHFRIYSEHGYGFYDTNFTVKDNEFVAMECNCPQFKSFKSCKHIAAAMIKEYENVITDYYELTEEILDKFMEGNFSNHKEIMRLELEFIFYANTVNYKAKVGTKKTYVLTDSKIRDFINAYKNGKTYVFGKAFTYDPNIHVFSDEDREIIDYLFNYQQNKNYYYSSPNELNQREFEALLKLLKDREFSVYDAGVVKKISKELPPIFELQMQNDDYVLEFINNENYQFLGDELRYLYLNQTLYLIPDNIRKIFNLLNDRGIQELKFKEDKLPIFKKGLLKNIKNQLVVNENVKDFTIPKEHKALVYFDINQDHILGKVKFDYDGKVINSFDNDETIVRDYDYEMGVYQELDKYKFIKKDKDFILFDFDDVCDFLDFGIIEFSEKYETFTSEKMKNTNIFKKTRIESAFGIGQDGILSYQFKVDDGLEDEMSKILATLKAKKKYYKLKSGDILKLEDNEKLLELESLVDDLEVDSKSLVDGMIEIPKYRAFYLQSLKENKYKDVATNDVFDAFIDNFKKYKNTKIKFSNRDESLLRSYQKEGVKWLYTIYKCDFGGILADEMGLGKSFQTICFIKQVLKDKKNAKVLVICPTSLVYNWKVEFDKYGEDIKYLVLAENKKIRKELLQDISNYQVLITSYGLVRNDFDDYEKMDFEVCVIDEAQTIKNYQADMTKCVKKIKAKTKIALSGTPLENSVLELWSIFDFIMPGYLNTIMKFREKYQVKDVDEKSLDILKNLNYQIKPFILRRLKKDVVKDLPEKLENVVYLDLPDYQKALYKKLVDDTKERMDALIAEKGYRVAQFEILSLLLRLREVCIDPTVIYPEYKEHIVKYDYLLDIVNSYIRDGHKILIFSTFKKVIENVKQLFDNNSISNYVIDGSVKGKTRVELVDAFNKDDTNCFLITLKAGGTGLNLTAADIVIHLEIWWNPQVENQATDRAHRIGQTKNVMVVKLVTKGTIEEKILELQQKKKIVADNVMDGHSTQVLSKITEDELRNLLTIDMN